MTKMQHSEATFVGADGINLYYQSWKPDVEPRAAVAIVHGGWEHSGRYMNLVNCLVPAGYAFYAFDLRGHGRSPGQRAYINSWSEFREDVRALLQMIARQEPTRPLFLFGHSMGGLIVLEYVLHYPDGLAGVISSAPIVGEIGISPFLLLLSRIISRVYPRFSLSTGQDVTALSRDQAVVQAYRDDPLVHGVGTARLGAEFVAAREYTVAHAADLCIPLLLIYGTADRLSSPEGCRAFFDRVTFPDKTRIEYPGGYHESHNDIDYKKVMSDLEGWLNSHVKD
jgi:alpha-beta hydrolase superfamily lysophospholipase